MDKTNMNIDDLKTKISEAANMMNGINESNNGLDSVICKFGIARPDKDSDRRIFIDFQCKGKKGTSGSFNINMPFTTEAEKTLMNTLGLLSKTTETNECEKKTTEDPGFPAKWKVCRIFGSRALISESITDQEIIAARQYKIHLYLLKTNNGCDRFLANFENLPLDIGERIVATNKDFRIRTRTCFLDPELFDFREAYEAYTKRIWEISSLGDEEEGLLGYEPTKECRNCIHKACPKRADYAAVIERLREAMKSTSDFRLKDINDMCWCPKYQWLI